MSDDDSDDPARDEDDWNPDPAMVSCPECGAEVSEEADRCPECGHYFTPDDANGGRTLWYRIAVAFIIALLVWTLIAWW